MVTAVDVLLGDVDASGVSGPFGYVPSPLEVHAFPDDAAAWAVRVPPGWATAGVLAQLDPSWLSQAGRVDAMVALDRLQAWAAALQARVITALVEHPPASPGGTRTAETPADASADAPAETAASGLDLGRRWATEDVRIALGESLVGARSRIHVAAELVHRLPVTLRALESGRITTRHTLAVTDTVAVLDDTQARAVEQAVVPVATGLTAPVPTMASFRKKLRRAADRVDARSAADRATRAAQDRDVQVIPQQNAMTLLQAPLPAEGAAVVMAAVRVKADQIKTADDPRTTAQRRADGLVQICADYLNGDTTGQPRRDSPGKINPATPVIPTRHGADAPRYHGLAPRIQVSVALSTLLGLDDQPADLDSYGPIPADIARRIAADPTGTWRRLITDKQGRLVDYGRSAYTPPTDLARHVIARDRTCRAPGCTRPAVHSDLHHITPFSHGGQTNAANLISACERHHYLLHDGRWTVRQAEDGTTAWASTTGHTYPTPPAAYPTDHTTHPDPRKIKPTTPDDADTNRTQPEQGTGTQPERDMGAPPEQDTGTPPF